MPLTHRFRAEIKPTLKQGDHDVIAVYYRTDDGEDRRVTTAILPEKIAREYLALVNGEPLQNVTCP